VTLAESEFAVLRQTIATRGTVRIVTAPLTFFTWAAIVLVLVLFSELPIAALLSLAVLIAGFEAIHALHVGVERIGRYLQVYYEDTTPEVPAGAPRWETTAMRAGPGLPGAGADPLFSILFLGATVLNLVAVFLPQPVPIEIGVIGVLHLLFALRVVRARLAASKQRRVELERYRALRAGQRPKTEDQRLKTED
jgi:hypothetical protein